MITLLKAQSTGKTTAIHEVLLEQLFSAAEELGHVSVFSDQDGTPGSSYCVTIHFPVPTGCELKARSDFGLSMPDALMQAIERAEKIRRSFK